MRKRPPAPSLKRDVCAICGHWPERSREDIRAGIDTIPLREFVCLDCKAAWMKNCFGLIAEETRH